MCVSCFLFNPGAMNKNGLPPKVHRPPVCKLRALLFLRFASGRKALETMAPFLLPQGKPWHPNTPNKQKLRQTHEGTMHTVWRKESDGMPPRENGRGQESTRTPGFPGCAGFFASGSLGEPRCPIVQAELLGRQQPRTTAAPDDLSGWLQPLFLRGSYSPSKRRWALTESEALGQAPCAQRPPCLGGWLASSGADCGGAEPARLGRTVGTSRVL